MFQCLGLGTVEDGGCGEDWWHPECIVGLGRDWCHKNQVRATTQQDDTEGVGVVKTENNNIPTEASEGQIPGGRVQQSAEEAPLEEEHPLPPGFPAEEDFEHLICYKCTAAHPWIKRYAGASGFLVGVAHHDSTSKGAETRVESEPSALVAPSSPSGKRKASDSDLDNYSEGQVKKWKPDEEPSPPSLKTKIAENTCTWSTLTEAPPTPTSLFLQADFRDHLCRCFSCFPRLAPHPQLLEEEEVYEPPQSEDGSEVANVPGSVRSAGSRSLLDRGEAALSNMDRVRAIEGVMAYNHLRDKVKDFLKPFAESGQAVGAEDVKKYFEKLRGDEEAIRVAAMGGDGGGGNGGAGKSDGSKGQGGY